MVGWGRVWSADPTDHRPGMTREWQSEGTYALALPDWGVASDHRPIITRFFAEDK